VALAEAGDLRHALGEGVPIHRQGEEVGGDGDVAPLLELQDRVGDEAQVLGVDVEGALVDPGRLDALVVVEHEVGDRPVLAHGSAVMVENAPAFTAPLSRPANADPGRPLYDAV
jgi:hypothetical protein